MPLSRTNPPGWSVGEKLTSAQINALDTALTNALDKRSGQSDTLQSVVTASGPGRVIDSYAIGPDADASIQLSVANRIYVPTLTADRTYTLSATGAVVGDEIKIRNSSTFKIVVKDQAAATLASLGPDASSDSAWASFVFTASGWVVFSLSSTAKPTAQRFTANGTWTCPAGVSEVLCIGWGGGGGGGGGGFGTAGANLYATGGGGGGSSQRVSQRIAVTPGTTYNVNVGAGGSGGAGNSFGADGSPTTLTSGASTLFAAAGGQGGGRGIPAYGGAPWVSGGAPTSSAPLAIKDTQCTLAESIVQRTPGGGGGAGTNTAGGVGCGSIDGLPGGNGGNAGTASGTYMPGGGGGGGGGAVMDRALIVAAGLGNGMPAGTAGGNGANGNNAGAGGAGSVGATSSYANSGAGGGGGGGGGCGSSTGGSGGAGGSGVSGALYIIQIH